MPAYNRVILAGNMTRDPEMRYTPKGTPIAKFGLGVNRHWTTESGEKKEDVTFLDVTFFGKPAQTLCEHTSKGSPLLIEGRLEQETWQDKESKENRSKIVVIGESFQFLGSRAAAAADKAIGTPT